MKHCIKCGTKIMEHMAFCPECGSNVAEKSDRAVHTQSRSEPGPSSHKFSFYHFVIFFGILFMMFGTLIWTGWHYLEPPDDDDYEEGYGDPSYIKDVDRYYDNTRIITTTGELVASLGLYLFCFGLMAGVLRDKSISDHTRLGMLISLGLVLGLKLTGIQAIFYGNL